MGVEQTFSFKRNPLILSALIAFSFISGYCQIAPEIENAPALQKSVMLEKNDFNSDNLLASEHRNTDASGFSFLDRNRFSMQQSYSLSYASGGAGSMSSGLYLNTLNYKLSNPLTLSVDLGFYTPISSTIPGARQNTLMSQGTGSSFVLPRVGLEYRPNDRFVMNLDLVNMQDAYKAYGSPYAQPFWNRLP